MCQSAAGTTMRMWDFMHVLQTDYQINQSYSPHA